MLRGGDGSFIYLTSALAALNGLLFGFDTGIISGAFLLIKDTFVMSPLIVGILVSYLVNFAFADAGAWRIMLGAGMVPALVLAIGMTKMPESPRWLYEQGRTDEARAVLILPAVRSYRYSARRRAESCRK